MPDGYVLYEHARPNATLQDGSKKRTTHDVYLHGWSSNPAQKFRSPAEFFLHLVWLVSGAVPGSCGCRLCFSIYPDKVVEDPLQAREPSASLVIALDDVKIEDGVKIEEGNSHSPYSFSKGTSLIAVAGIKLITISGHALPMHRGSTKEQMLDSEPKGKFLYRPGELVWFNKNVSTWGLAVISSRQSKDGRALYLIQPLSHPLHHPSAEVRDQDFLRPWLAWSVPTLGNQSLQNAKYDQVPWEQIIAHYPTDPVVDGSILSAGAIDASYSLFEQDKTALSNTGEKFYKGLYLGAEKIWVLEPVRLRGPGEGIYVLVIKKIIEVPNATFGAEVVLRGDVYTLTRIPAPIQDRDIPRRMEDDLDFRNRVERTAEDSLWNDWRIVEPNAKKFLGDIKGRWYETEHLLPVLQGREAFNESIHNKVVGDCGMWMNARGDLKVSDIKQKDRRSTIGRAVPDNFRIHLGLDDSQPFHFPDTM